MATDQKQSPYRFHRSFDLTWSGQVPRDRERGFAGLADVSRSDRTPARAVGAKLIVQQTPLRVYLVVLLCKYITFLVNVQLTNPPNVFRAFSVCLTHVQEMSLGH